MKITKTPNKVYLALSGGSDSMFALHFLLAGRKDVTCLHFNHRTSSAKKYEEFVTERCNDKGVDLKIGRLEVLPPKGCSKEKHWRDERYKFFQQFTDAPIVTAHHLDDQIETMLMGFCKGKEQKIHSHLKIGEAKIVRPFLGVAKAEIESYNAKHGVLHMVDKSNFDITIPRNRMRHNVIPQLVESYPGLYKTLKRK